MMKEPKQPDLDQMRKEMPYGGIVDVNIGTITVTAEQWRKAGEAVKAEAQTED